MHDERGMTLVELIVVVAIVSIVVTVTVVYSAPWIARETLRSSTSDVTSLMQLAKIEAVSRNRDCRMVLDTSARTLRVMDTMGTSSTSDDTELYERVLPVTVTFARPDTGSAVTTQAVGGTEYQTVFTSAGMVGSGTGNVYMLGGAKYGTVGVHAAGGVEVEYWDGSSWNTGF